MRPKLKFFGIHMQPYHHRLKHFQHPFQTQNTQLCATGHCFSSHKYRMLDIIHCLWCIYYTQCVRCWLSPTFQLWNDILWKNYSKNAHGSRSLIPKMENIWNVFLIVNERVSIMAIASKHNFSEVCVNHIYKTMHNVY
jgi:hypothetical protein